MIHSLPSLRVPGSSQDCEHKTATTESLTGLLLDTRRPQTEPHSECSECIT